MIANTTQRRYQAARARLQSAAVIENMCLIEIRRASAYDESGGYSSIAQCRAKAGSEIFDGMKMQKPHHHIANAGL